MTDDNVHHLVAKPSDRARLPEPEHMLASAEANALTALTDVATLLRHTTKAANTTGLTRSQCITEAVRQYQTAAVLLATVGEQLRYAANRLAQAPR